MNALQRRQILIASGALVGATGPSVAQQPGKVYRIGILRTVGQAGQLRNNGGWAAFLERLRAHGYVEGQNLQIEARSAEGRLERLPELAAELAVLKLDVLTAITNPPLLALQRATSTTPIVIMCHEAVAVGLVASLARPGGNITGIDGIAPDLDGKRLQLLRELAPRATRIAALYNPAQDPAMRIHLTHAEDAAHKMGLAVRPFEVQRAEDFDGAFAAVVAERLDALITFTDEITGLNSRRIAEFALVHKLPSVFEFSFFIDAGGLISYGTDVLYFYRRAADYVHRILIGAKPADLPVEHPTTFELVINRKTAAALGITIPQAVLLRAERVIE